MRWISPRTAATGALLWVALAVSACAEEGAPSALRFVRGRTTTYAVELDTRTTLDYGALVASLPQHGSEERGDSRSGSTLRVHVVGAYVETVLGGAGDQMQLALAFRGPRAVLEMEGQPNPQGAAMLEADLSRWAFAVVTSDGRVVGLRTHPLTSGLAASVLRAWCGVTQFVVPAARGRSWATEEDDPAGVYAARYEVESQAGADGTATSVVTIRKAKGPYRERAPERSARGPTVVPTRMVASGSLLGRMHASGGFLVHLEGSDVQLVEASGKAIARSTMTVRVDRTGEAQATAAALEDLREEHEVVEMLSDALPLSWRPPEAEFAKAGLRADLGDATLESLLAELEGEERGPRPLPASSALFRKFRALVWLHPEAVETLGALLERASARGPTLTLLSDVFADVGTAQTQALLSTALTKRRSEREAVGVLLNALTAVPEPTPVAVDAVQRIAFAPTDAETSFAASLALGSMAKRLAAFSEERAEAVAATLVAQLEAASDPAIVRNLLLALGNAGSTRSLPAIQRFLDHTSPALRAAAVDALRFLPGDGVDLLLGAALRTDADASVRLTAAGAFAYRTLTPDSCSAQLAALKDEKSDLVRIALLENLWKARDAFPEAGQVVRHVAEKDPSPDVRERARAMIEASR